MVVALVINCEGGPRDLINLDDFADVRAASHMIVYTGMPNIFKIPSSIIAIPNSYFNIDISNIG